MKKESRPIYQVVKKNINPTYAQLIQAVNIYSDYWDCIPEEERAELDKRLKEVNC